MKAGDPLARPGQPGRRPDLPRRSPPFAGRYLPRGPDRSAAVRRVAARAAAWWRYRAWLRGVLRGPSGTWCRGRFIRGRQPVGERTAGYRLQQLDVGAEEP